MRLVKEVVILVVGVLLSTSHGQDIIQQTCSDPNSYAMIEPSADAIIGGLICVDDMQAYEALRLAIEVLNKENVKINGELLNTSYVPGIKLGMRVKNACGGNEAAIAGAASLFPQLSSPESSCTNTSKLILGVIGTSSSGTTIAVSDYLEKYNIPIISYQATAPRLSNKLNYPNFMRTIPPDGPLMDVIIKVFQRIKWDHIVIIYEDSVYGRSSYEEILPRLSDAGICLKSAIRHDEKDTAAGTLERALLTNTTGVLYLGGVDLADQLLQEGENHPGAGKLQWIFTDSINLNKKFQTRTYQRGIISILPSSRNIVEFEDHWVRIEENSPSAENPWFKKWYMEQNKCRLSGFTEPRGFPPCNLTSETEQRQNFVQNPFVEPAIHAVFTYANALRAAHRELCGPNAFGMCDRLKNLTPKEFYQKHLKNVNFKYNTEERISSLSSYILEPYNTAKQVDFDINGDIITRDYDIWNFNNLLQKETDTGEKFRLVGRFLGNILSINRDHVEMYDENRAKPLPSIPTSGCIVQPCGPCLGVAPQTKYFYQHGDVVLTGLFSLHQKGISPLTCGAFDKSNIISGAQYLQGMIYALYKVVQNNDILRGVRLGGLAFDDCMNSVLGTTTISQVQQGALTITDSSGNVLDPRKIDGYMAAHSSQLTFPMAELMNIFKRPLIGYASLDEDLLEYPYFLRSTQGSAFEKRAIVKMLKRLGYEYVQLVYEDSEYFVKGNADFRRIAAEEGICVITTIKAGMDGSETIRMLRKRKHIKPVILNIGIMGNKRFLEGVNQMNASGEFALFGLHTFGTYQQVVEGNEDAADGVISLDLQRSSLTEYQNYLRGLRVSTEKDRNPWFSEWYQHVHQCYLPNSDVKTYTKPCPDVSNTGIPDAVDYKLMYYVESSINAVYAFAYGLNATLVQYCGAQNNGVCDDFLNAKDKGEVLVQKIKEVNFIPENSPYTVRFNDRSIDQPAIFYNYVNGQFIRIGEYQGLNNNLRVDRTPIFYNNTVSSMYKPMCPQMCRECFYMFQHQDYMYIDGDLIIPGMFDVHYSKRHISPFSCGSLRSENGFQYVEAFAFALDYVNNGQAGVKLNNNLKLGGLAFDGCSNSLRATTLTNAFQSSAIRFKNNNGGYIDQRKTLAWLGYDSQSTINMAELLGSIGIPVVSPGATSPLLKDKQRFHSFFRTIPSEGYIARAMADLTQTLGFKYVITVNSPDTAMREAKDHYRQYLKDNGICVLASYEFVTDGSLEIIINSMSESTTRAVAIFAEPDMYVKEMMELKQRRYPNVDFVFISNRKFDAKRNNFAVAVENALSFDMDVPTVQEFLNYLSGLQSSTNTRNPWFNEYYEEKFACQLFPLFSSPQVCSSKTTSIVDSNFQQDLYVLSTINAVYALTEGVHRTLQEKCGVSYTSVCGRYLTDVDTNQRLMDHMDRMNFTDIVGAYFEFMEREARQSFSVSQYKNGDPLKVASLISGNLTYNDEKNLQNTYKDVKSSCDKNCDLCADSKNNFGDFTHIYGDIYFVGLFDVHKKGATPFSCGSLNDKHGFQLLEAFNYAVEYVNDKKGIFRDKLNGVDIGAIGLDVCQNPTRAANLVTNIHSNSINLVDPLDGTLVQPSRFDVYIGPFDTDSSIRVADVLDALSIPQITYGATSLELQNKKKYRYFLRSVPADDKQARAIISYLKRFDNNFVQIISTFDSVGLKGKEEFKRLAPLNKICIEKEITIGYDGPVTAAEANRALDELKANLSAKVVVLFVDDPRVILQAIDVNAEIRENFFFIGTDKWGMDTDMLFGLNDLISSNKVVTFDVETADVPGFDDYLQYKTPDNYKRNPWFKEYYEQQFQCDTKEPNCIQNLYGISRNEKYVQDPYVLYVVNAVFAAALGVHNSLVELCVGGNNRDQFLNGVCSLFRTSGERRQRIHRGITKANFIDDTYQPFYFLETGESDRGYHIYDPKIESSEYVYDNVGSYNDTHFLKIDITYDMKFKSSCIEGVNCPCIFPKYEPSRYMLKKSSFNLNLVYVANLHQAVPNDPFQCGMLSSMSNFQSMLAFFYAIDQVNGLNTYPASLKLGGLAVDGCSQPMRIGEDVYSLLSGEGLCHSSGRGQIISPSSIVSFHALSTDTSVPLSRILTPHKILSLSPGATSVSLSDKRLHPYFLRTVPPDDIQVILMLKVMKQFGWNYGSIIYTNSGYGISARDALIRQASFANLKTCFGVGHALAYSTSLTEVEEILVSLSQKVGSRVVILFTDPAHSRLILQATKNKGLTGRFVWLASDYWANSMEIVQGYEEEAVGALTVQIRSKFVQSFNNFMISLNMTNRKGIPDDWFEEFYQTIHKCRILNSQVTKQFPRICTGSEKITEDMINQDPFVLHTIIAVYQIAEGLNGISACRSSGLDLYACLSLQPNRRQLIYNNVLGAQLNLLYSRNESFPFKFTADGYGDIGYNILNFHRDVTKDKYVYTKIGEYQESLTINRLAYRGKSILTVGVIPLSTCPPSINCSCYAGGALINEGGAIVGSGASGDRIVVEEGGSVYRFVHRYTDTGYILGSDGTYLEPKTGALLIVKAVRKGADRFYDIWGIILAALAAIGAFIALCMFIYLLVVYPVRSGTTILGFLLLFGIILMYLLVFAFIFHASPEICALRRFALGFVYALVYAVLFVKLVDCWRSKNAGDYSEVKYSKIGRPVGLLFLVIMLVLVQIIICAEWLILVAPGYTTIYYNQYIWPLCLPIGWYDAALVLSLVYVMFLIILCVIFGFACFSSPRNHYESRWILGIAILSIPTWVIWCLVAVLADYEFRDAAVAVGLLLNATYMLLCGSLRKLYLLNKYQALIDEEEKELEKEKKMMRANYSDAYDNRQNFMGSMHGSVHGSMHGSVHGSRHGTLQGRNNGYTYVRGNRGQLIMVQTGHGAQGGRLHSNGSSVHNGGGMVLVRDQTEEEVFHGHHSSGGGGMIIQEDIHPMADDGHYSEVNHGSGGMVIAGGSGDDSMRILSSSGGEESMGMFSGEAGGPSTSGGLSSSQAAQYTQVVRGGDGGVSVSEAFGSRGTIPIYGNNYHGPNVSIRQHSEYEAVEGHRRVMEYTVNDDLSD